MVYIFLTYLLEYNCFTMVWQILLYNKVNTYIPISPPSCVSLPPSLSHLSRWSQSTELISLCYVASSHQLSILHLVVYICPCHSLCPSLPFPLRVSKMGRRPKLTFLQRRYTDCQRTHERMINITNHQRNANQNCNEVSPHTSQNGHH